MQTGGDPAAARRQQEPLFQRGLCSGERCPKRAGVSGEMGLGNDPARITGLHFSPFVTVHRGKLWCGGFCQTQTLLDISELQTFGGLSIQVHRHHVQQEPPMCHQILGSDETAVPLMGQCCFQAGLLHDPDASPAGWALLLDSSCILYMEPLLARQ